MTSQKVIIVPMDGHANQWGAEQPVDLQGNRKSHFSGSASKKSKDGLFTITSILELEPPLEYLLMLSSIEIIDVLKSWNPWGGAFLAKNTFPRKVLPTALRFLETNHVLAFIGVRRSGKSTLMFQLMEKLIDRGQDEKNVLYVNFEEPLFTRYLAVDLLDAILSAYSEIIGPSEKPYLFFDEIQNIPSWERWVRIKADQGTKIIVSGSSSKLLSSELATLLTGRHISFQVCTFSFLEFLGTKGIHSTDLLGRIKEKTKIRAALHEYLKWGGFPEVILSSDEYQKRTLLRQYFEDIIYKDVAYRHGVKDINLLKELAVYGLTNIGNKMSYSRLARELSLRSVETVRNYFSFLKEAFLIHELPRFSNKYREQIKAPRKIYAMDVGMRNAIAFRFSRDIGRIAENFVFLELYNQGYQLYYLEGKKEVDFYGRHGENDEMRKLLNVAWKINEKRTRQRELSGLEEAMKKLAVANALLLTERVEEEITIPSGEGTISVRPLWRWASEENHK